MFQPQPKFSSPTKKSLRQHLRLYRRSLCAAAQRRAALGLCRQFLRLPALKSAKTIALYSACDGEINPSRLLRRLCALGKQVYLPRLSCSGHAMEFARYRPGDKLRRHRLGLQQPLPKASRISADNLDIVVLPLVGFDNLGNRLGMGGGFYDRTFARVDRRPLLIGIAHVAQQITALPVDPWDVPLSWIATDRTLIRVPRIRRLMG